MIDTIQNVTGIGQTAAPSTTRRVSPGKAKASAEEATGTPAPPTGSTGGLSGLVNDINDLVYELSATTVTFDVDDATGRHVVRVLNKETGDVIRQLPPEALLNLVARMRQLTGLIFSEEA